jgi:hypothetical protein
MQRMIKSIALSAVMVLGLVAGAWAMDLDAAKSQGLVGERPDGYLGAVAANTRARASPRRGSRTLFRPWSRRKPQHRTGVAMPLDPFVGAFRNKPAAGAARHVR